MSRFFRSKNFLRATTLMIAGLAITAAAHATTFTYTLTLTPNASSAGKIGGTVTFSTATAIPASGNFYASQNGSISSTTTNLLSLSIVLSNGVSYSFSGEQGTANATFFNDMLSNFSYTDNSGATNQFAIGGQTYNYSTNGNYSGTAYTAGVLSLTPQTVTATPEPSSLVLLGTGLIGLGSVVRRRFFA